MSESKTKAVLHLDRAHVVGTFHSGEKEGSHPLETAQLRGVDAVEFRLDLLGRLPSPKEIAECRKPMIMTARHPEEGGSHNLDKTDRHSLLQEATPLATLVDLELRFWDEFSPVLKTAQESGTGVIASFHDFSGTPPFSELLEKVRRARQLGAAIFKVATKLNRPGDLACLLQLLDQSASLLPVAAMGMGPLGMVSRLALAHCGSILNYGWLVRPLIPGQWPAVKFAERLNELSSESDPQTS